MLRSGSLNKRMIFETPTDTPTAGGDPGLTWSTFATRWVSLHPLAGDERTQAHQVVAQASHEVRMHYLAGLTTRMRGRIGSRIFNIGSVIDPEEQHRELRLTCTEEV